MLLSGVRVAVRGEVADSGLPQNWQLEPWINSSARGHFIDL